MREKTEESSCKQTRQQTQNPVIGGRGDHISQVTTKQERRSMSQRNNAHQAKNKRQAARSHKINRTQRQTVKQNEWPDIHGASLHF